MTTINWTGSKGQLIELRAECSTKMVKRESNLDGHIFIGKEEPYTSASLELYVDGEKVDSCRDTSFWEVIDTRNGIKKIWGLNCGMTNDQAIIVEKFLKEVIETGKTIEVVETEQLEAKKEAVENIENANKTMAKYESQSLKLNANQYQTWRTDYNNANNEGGEGYIPSLVTTEQYEYAKGIAGGTL